MGWDVDLSIIVVSWNTRDLVRRCLESIETSKGSLEVETIVVDNASTDGSAEMVVREFPCTMVIRNADNRGFAAANNQAIAVSRGRHVLLLNSDAILVPESAESMLNFLDKNPDVGAVGARLLNADGTFQASFADFPTLLSELLLLTKLSKVFCSSTYPSYPAEQSTTTRAVDWVVGACLMARRRAIDDVGQLDEDYFMYTEETDWCYRLWKRGWGVYYLSEVKIPHWSGQSSGKAPERKRSQLYRSKLLFLRKHRGRVSSEVFRFAVRGTAALSLCRALPACVIGSQFARARARSYALLLRQI